jgi:GntR family transcriptional regulator, transcriptional repressor for pyruvate dehydrogenase complex
MNRGTDLIGAPGARPRRWRLIRGRDLVSSTLDPDDHALPLDQGKRGATMSEKSSRSMGLSGVGFDEPERRVIKTSETVALNVVHDIVARSLKTGDKLPLEVAMLQQYRVSRASLREALRLLEVQGIISIRPGPGGGPVVGSVDARHLARTASLYFHLGGMTYADIFATQEILEPTCAQLACRHPDRAGRLAPFLDPKQTSSQVATYHAASADFHSIVYELAGNAVLGLLTKAITSIITSHIVSTMDPVEMHETILEDHKQIARAITAGRESKAYRLTVDHFAAQHDFYKRNWPARFDELIEWR